MAETAVGLVIDKLIPLLTEEAHLLRGIHEEVEDIKCDLDFLMAFLNDADKRAETDDQQGTSSNQGVKLWVRKLREASFELEDVVDEYTHLMAQCRGSHRHRFIAFLRRSSCLIVKLKVRHDIASKIRDIRGRVGDINGKSAAYGFNSTGRRSELHGAQNADIRYDPRKHSRLLKEAEVVGIESDRDALIKKLDSDQSSPRNVISLVGMGGLGKTTLAHQVYVHVKGRFDCCAWIEVSQSYKKVELLRSLIKKLYQAREEPCPEGIDAMDDTEVTIKLRDYLQGKRYFVVFDDIWDSNFWPDVQDALPDEAKTNGRILITTRDMEVANFCRTSSSFVHIHRLRPMHMEKAWELFCNKAFGSEPEKNCPTDLQELSWRFVERCEGLPLAIVVIAGLLETKDTNVEEWRKLYSNLSSELENNKHLKSVTQILSLSYNELPYNLKSCFLYFGIFQEDYSIRYGRLIRQWIAEGFVKLEKNKTLEVVAEEYLADLINRSLVQVSKLDFDGKPRFCRVHDLLREIILEKMEDLSICQVFPGTDSNFTSEGEMPDHSVKTIATRFKLLKVLDFEDAPSLPHVHEDVGNLFHLKYLSLRGTRVKSLPKSIGRLENLETLDLKQTLVYELPVEINRLRKLRHLLAYYRDYKIKWSINRERGVKIEKGIEFPKSLQKLYFIEADSGGAKLFKELSKLTELRKLGIKRLRNEDGATLCSCIQKMENLECLSVSSGNEYDIIDLESVSSPPQFLRRLYIKGHLSKLPEWITKLKYLVRLHIHWSKLVDDPLKVLQNLHNLLELGILDDAYKGEQLVFEKGALPKLKVLQLSDLGMLKSIVIDKGALSGLHSLSISWCPKLNALPSGLQHLKEIEKIDLFEMSSRFVIFQDFQSLQTIPQFRFFYQIDREFIPLRLEWIMALKESMKQEHTEEEWESFNFGEFLREFMEQLSSASGSNSL